LLSFAATFDEADDIRSDATTESNTDDCYPETDPALFAGGKRKRKPKYQNSNAFFLYLTFCISLTFLTRISLHNHHLEKKSSALKRWFH
jgi:hypothetical protein